MPNFEYYRKEYLGSAQKRYEQAMAMAYRDLLLEYKDAAIARQQLQKQLQFDEKIQAKKLELITKAASEGKDKIAGMSMSEFITATKGYDAAVADVKDFNSGLQKEAEKLYAEENELTAAQRATIQEWINKSLTSLSGTKATAPTEVNFLLQNDLFGDTWVAISNDPGKVDAMLSIYGPQIAEKLDVTKEYAAELIGGVYIPEKERQQFKDKYIDDFIKRNERNLTPQMQDLGAILGVGADELNTIIKAKRVTTTPRDIDDVDETFEVVEEREDLPLPTPEKIRARAAQYYAPFASEGFQEVVGFREPKPEPKPTEEEVELTAISELPTYAGKLFGVAKQVDQVKDLDDAVAIKQGGVGAQYGNQLLRSGDDYQTAMSKIETNESLDDTQKEAAYVMLGRDLYRKNQEQTKLPSLEELMVSRI